jgi:hypothetical protein
MTRFLLYIIDVIFYMVAVAVVWSVLDVCLLGKPAEWTTNLIGGFWIGMAMAFFTTPMYR